MDKILKIIIAGTRDLNLDYCPVATDDYQDRSNIGRIIHKYISSQDIEMTEVISGNFGVIDKLAILWATLFEKPYKIFNADWNAFGKYAGPIRNRNMAEYGDMLLAIMRAGGSKGTQNMIDNMVKLNKIVIVHRVDDKNKTESKSKD